MVEDIFQSSMLNDLSSIYNGDLIITDLCDVIPRSWVIMIIADPNFFLKSFIVSRTCA